MAAIKSFTSLEQSKKLAKILPIDTADMWYSHYGDPKYNSTIAYEGEQWFLCQLRNSSHDIPCWSLAALLSVLPKYTRVLSCHCSAFYQNIQEFYPAIVKNNDKYVCRYAGSGTWTNGDNAIDVCYEMILKLHGLKRL